MTIFFPDISDIGNRGLKLEPNTIAVTAKASEGTSFQDPSYNNFKQQAADIGAHFSAYHWLWPGNAAAQAANAFDTVGPDVDLMLDQEEESVVVTVHDAVDFVNEYHARGGKVSRIYLPRWYWQGHMGSPDLRSLQSLGLLLVASDYSRPYMDDAWPVPYGGYDSVFQWQYTDHFWYGGQHVDFNAVKLPTSEFIAAISNSPVTPSPTPTSTKDFAMTNWTNVRIGDTDDSVRIVQGLLIAHGYKVGSVNGFPDGVFGPVTEASTRALQQAKGITVDGIFGPHTLSVALYDRDLA